MNNSKPRPFSKEKALVKINKELQAGGLPQIEDRSGIFFVEKGNFICCQIKARRPRHKRGRISNNEVVWAYGYGFAKFNPFDVHLGMTFDPNMGRRLALRRAVQDMVETYKAGTNGQ